ncbi:MAG: ATP-binding protein, partial [bacterium]
IFAQMKRFRAYIMEKLGEIQIIFENAPVGIYTILPDGTISTFNPKMVELSGVEYSQKIIGQNALKLDTYKKAGMDKFFKRGLAGESFEVETPYTSHFGHKTTHRHYIGTPLFVPNTKKVSRLLLIVQDITKQKELEKQNVEYSKNLELKVKQQTKHLEHQLQMEENSKKAMQNILEDYKQSEGSLKKERDRANAILSSMDEGVILTNQENNIVLINQAGGTALHTAPADTIGKKISHYIKLEDANEKKYNVENYIKNVIGHGDIARIGLGDKLFCKPPNNSKFPISLLITPFHSDGISGSVLVFKNIIKDKQLDEAKSSFISVASHQLRTPLTSIRWYAEMLRAESMKNFTEKERKYTENIYNGALRLNEIINLLLSLSRIESGKVQSKIEKLNCSECLAGILTQLSSQITKKAVHIEKEIDDDLPAVFGDRLQIEQALSNLLSNAINYSHTGGTIKIITKKEAGGIKISIKDNGIGIPTEEKNKIFDRFFRASNAIKIVPNGSGLGLTLVKELVKSWGGQIEFTSEENRGSTFSFTIPHSSRML